MKLFDFQKKNWKFIKSQLEETSEDVCNPGRGWYQLYAFRAESLPDFTYLKSCVLDCEKLALVMINIGAYKSRSLDSAALDNIVQIISFFVEQKKDIILRFVYDDKGKGLEHEPWTLGRIEDHIRSLEPVFREFGDHLYILQGLFIGSWGEMHTSKFLSEECMRRLYGILLSVTDEQTFLSVRRPMYWRMLEEADTSCRLGLFNDGMLASESHLGTFGTKARGRADWKEAWIPQDELAFIEQLCKKVPLGGEAVLGELSNELSPEETIELLKKMHVSYLNNMHDRRLLAKWKQQIWKNGTLYEYIGSHLGYRFVIRNVNVRFPLRKESMTVEIRIENTGFSNCYEEGTTYLELDTPDGKTMCLDIGDDLRKRDAGTIVSLTVDMPLAEGKLYLRSVRKKDGAVIRYAQKEKNDRIYAGAIRCVHRN